MKNINGKSKIRCVFFTCNSLFLLCAVAMETITGCHIPYCVIVLGIYYMLTKFHQD